MNPLDPKKFPDVDIYQSPLKDSGSVLYILRGQHKEAVTLMSFFPFIDTPIGTESIWIFLR